MHDQWREIIQSGVQEAMDLAEQTRRFVVEEAFPSLTEKQPPEARLAFYESLDFDALKVFAPSLYAAFSQDYLDLRERLLRPSLTFAPPPEDRLYG